MTETEAIIVLRMVQGLIGEAVRIEKEKNPDSSMENYSLTKRMNEAIDMACMSLTHDAIEIEKGDNLI